SAAAAFFFSSSGRHTRFSRDWSSDVCSSDLHRGRPQRRLADPSPAGRRDAGRLLGRDGPARAGAGAGGQGSRSGGKSGAETRVRDRKSTRLNSSHVKISYAVFCLKKKSKNIQ